MSVVLGRPLVLWHFVAIKEGRGFSFFSFLVPFFTKRIFGFLRISLTPADSPFQLLLCLSAFSLYFSKVETFAGGIKSSTTFQVLLNLFYLVSHLSTRLVLSHSYVQMHW